MIKLKSMAVLVVVLTMLGQNVYGQNQGVKSAGGIIALVGVSTAVVGGVGLSAVSIDRKFSECPQGDSDIPLWRGFMIGGLIATGVGLILYGIGAYSKPSNSQRFMTAPFSFKSYIPNLDGPLNHSSRSIAYLGHTVF